MDTNNTRRRLEASNARVQHGVNKWGARIIPAILIGLAGYSVWVVVVLLAIKYLLHPPSGVPRRIGVGTAILVIYFLLLILMGLSYFRVLAVVNTNPGYVPLPAEEQQRREARTRRKQRSSRSTAESTEKDDNLAPSQELAYIDRGSVSGGRSGPPAGLENFYTRDIFECEVDGLPRYCSICKTWKPDRTHHSREVGRCIFKMDHFCPWAGGIVSETSFKFFIQFLVYGAMWNLSVMIVTAYFAAEDYRRTHSYNTNWIVAAALAGMFFSFSAGMANASLFSTIKNSTTVDNLSARTRIHHFAILIPPLPAPPSEILGSSTTPPSIQPQTTSEALGSTPPTLRIFQPPRPYPVVTYPLPSSSPTVPSTPQRTFAILATPTGSNPYKLSSTLENIRTVMGDHIWDWFLPLRYSPCCDHGHKRWFGDGVGMVEEGRSGKKGYMYKLGPVVEKMIKEAGLSMPGEGR